MKMEGVPQPIVDQPSRAIVVSLPRELAPYARNQRRWRQGCSVQVLRDGGETYPAMLEALAAAKESILLESYILAADNIGAKFKEVLIERAQAGVSIRVIYDAVGSFGLPSSYADDLRAVGVEVIDFNPIAPWRRRFRLSHRDHRKVIVVDGVVGFTGGLNIADEYDSAERGGGGWHDMHCRVTGPIVLDLARQFRRTWLRAGGGAFAPISPGEVAPPGEGTSWVRMMDNTLLRQRGAFRRTYLHVIRNARRTLHIENAYFLPDRGVRRALMRAARRGVDVRIIVPGSSDVRVIEWASLYALRQLGKKGIKLFRWRGPMLHAKIATADSTWSTIGSYNFDSQSRFSNLEVNVEILDAEVAQALSRNFELTLAQSDPFDDAAWKRLPWWKKALAWLSFRFKRWL